MIDSEWRARELAQEWLTTKNPVIYKVTQIPRKCRIRIDPELLDLAENSIVASCGCIKPESKCVLTDDYRCEKWEKVF